MTERYQGYERLEFDYPHPRILRISFNRPERYNALDVIGHNEITYVWREVDADPDIDCVILTGKGKAFSAGGDFEMIDEIIADFDTRAQTWKEARDLVYNIINCGKPIISAINGPAVGAGLVAAGDHAAIIWPLLCGMAKAKYYLLTCDRLSGAEAERIGLVSLCVKDEDLQSRALEVAVQLSDGAPNAIRWTKYALNNWLRLAGPTFDASTALEMLGFTSGEAREGVSSLKEKRDPEFKKGSRI